MRGDRLLQLLLLLQRHRRLPAPRLAELLEVSVRTVLRDMEALSSAGVPVYTERGRGGGCVLMDGFTVDATGLTPAEAQALFAWTGRDSLADLGLSRALTSALTKVAATAPEAGINEAQSLGRVVVSDRRRWFNAADEVPHLPTLREACQRRRRVELSYQSARDRESTWRTVHPYGLIDQAGVWYLIAARDGDPRTYRASRIHDVRILDEPAEVPNDLDLGQLWRDLRSFFEDTMPGQPARVLVATEAEDLFRRVVTVQLAPGSGIAESGRTPESVELELTFRVTRAAVAAAVTFAPDVRVLGPPDLVDEVVRTVERAADSYLGRG